MRYGLRWRIVVLAAAAPAALSPAALRFVDRTVQEHVRITTDENLRRAALVCENVLAARARTLEASALAIAQDPRFLSALTLPASVNDPQYRATVRAVARDLNKIAKVDLFEVLDGKGRLIAAVGNGAMSASGRRTLLTQVSSKSRHTSGVLEGDEAAVYQVAANAVTAAGKVVAILILGERIDDDLAAELKALTRCEASFFIGKELAVTTLRHPADRAILTKSVQPWLAADPDLAQNKVFETKGAADVYLTLVRSIPAPGRQERVLLTVQRSLDQETAFLGAIHAGLGKLGALIALAALFFGMLVSYRISRPLMALVRGVEEMERGNYEYPIKIKTSDEIGYLAKRFSEIREHERVYVNSLEEVARLKSEFLSVASHELRTPVSIIKAYGELLGSGRLGGVSGEQKKALGVIDQQLDGITRIIEDAAWLAQVQGERRHLNLAEEPIRDIIKLAVAAANADASGRKHHFTLEIEPEANRARVDGPRLAHAVANLVRNAIRFTPDGGRVSVRARREADNLVIEVQDSGIGIAEDKKEHLFDRSFLLRDSLRHHSSRTLEFNSAGLGLGLPLARGIVEAHGGTISVESQVGRGSTFIVRIPLNHAADMIAAA